MEGGFTASLAIKSLKQTNKQSSQWWRNFLPEHTFFEEGSEKMKMKKKTPLITCTEPCRTSAPWVTLDIKQAEVERRQAERNWLGLTVHREIYVKQSGVKHDKYF